MSVSLNTISTVLLPYVGRDVHYGSIGPCKLESVAQDHLVLALRTTRYLIPYTAVARFDLSAQTFTIYSF